MSGSVLFYMFVFLHFERDLTWSLFIQDQKPERDLELMLVSYEQCFIVKDFSHTSDTPWAKEVMAMVPVQTLNKRKR